MESVNLKDLIMSRFRFLNDYTDGEYPLDGHDASVFRLDGEIGVMIDMDTDRDIDESFNAIRIRTSSFISENEKCCRKLVLSTRHSELDFLEKFSAVCSEFIDGDRTSKKRREILDNPFRWYQSWADVMGTRATRTLPTSVLAELITLDYLLRNGDGPIWEGASSNIIDIRAETFDCEVKSSTTRDSNIIHISSERQLLKDNKPLHLIYCCFQETEAGMSIEDMTHILTLHGYDRDSLEDTLDSLGYSKGKLARYSKYSLVKMWEFLIDESFPKITPESFIGGQLPLGITSFDYTVDLTGVPHREIDYTTINPKSDLSEYDIPRKWVLNKLSKGLKTMEHLRAFVDNQEFFNLNIAHYDWPANTKAVWLDLLNDVDSEINYSANKCWNLFESRIKDDCLSMSVLKDNCDGLTNALELRRANDRCIRLMAHSPAGIDTIDVISGTIAQGADSGWNLFLVVTDNYRIGSKQVVDRICSNLAATIDAYSWNVISSYSSDAEDIEPDNLRFDGFSKSRYLLTCLRSANSVNKIYNWIQSSSHKSNIRLMIIDHRSDMHMSVVSGRYPETFVVDNMVDRLTGYRTDEGDNNNEFGNLSYISFVPSPYHLKMNINYDVVNPYDAYLSIRPIRPYLGPSDIFSENSIFLVTDDVDIEMSSFKYGGHNFIPQSLSDAISWFICSSAILLYRDSKKVPCMTILSSKNWEASAALESTLVSFLDKKHDHILENCKRIYAEQSFSINGKRIKSDVAGLDAEIELPCYEDISAIIRKLVLSTDAISVHLDDNTSTNTEYDILNKPTILINSGSMIRFTQDSIQTVSYFHRNYNSNDVTMHPGPWYGNFGHNTDLIRIWMSERSASYFHELTLSENTISQAGRNSINNALHQFKKEKISEYSRGNVLKTDGMLKCGYDSTVCDLCDQEILPGTVYIHIDYKNTNRCLKCYREHANTVMASRYGYVTDTLADVKNHLIVEKLISFDKLIELSGSKKKAYDILGLLRMDGYVFKITPSDVILTWYPELNTFVSDLESMPYKTIYDKYRDNWKTYCNMLMDRVPEKDRLENHSECGFQECYEFFKGIDKNNISLPTGYEDISDNNDVYDDACRRIRKRIITSLAIHIFSDCTNASPVDNNHLEVDGEIHTFNICPASEYIPEDENTDITLIVDDDLYIIEDYMPVSIHKYFNFGPSFERIRDYMVKLLEAGF